jgi:aspartate 1-decarboxylase
MSICVCTGKLHRVTVTDARIDYEGSVTIDPLLMAAAGIVPFQLVHINSLANATHWETYAIPGVRGSGDLCLNGCPARLFLPGDKVIVLAFDQLTRAEAAGVEQRVVHVDGANGIVRTVVKTAPMLAAPEPVHA